MKKVTPEMLMDLLLRLHADPCQIFLSCFSIEMFEVQNLAAVMRESSVSVRVLQFIWRSFDFSPLVSPFQKFISRLTASKLKLLTENSEVTSSSSKWDPANRREALKTQLLTALRESFRAKNVPKLICVLCHKCAELVRSNARFSQEEIPVSVLHWAVGALIFLRFLIPSITAIASERNATEPERKGAILIGRLLMKICAGSEFREYPSSLLSEVLEMSSKLFSNFCDDVALIGGANFQLLYFKLESHPPLLNANVSEEELNLALLVFCSSHCFEIAFAILTRALKEDLLTPDEFPPKDVVTSIESGSNVPFRALLICCASRKSIHPLEMLIQFTKNLSFLFGSELTYVDLMSISSQMTESFDTKRMIGMDGEMPNNPSSESASDEKICDDQAVPASECEEGSEKKEIY